MGDGPEIGLDPEPGRIGQLDLAVLDGGEAAAETAATWVVEAVHNTGTTVSEAATQAWQWSTTPVRGAWNRLFGD